MAIEVKTYTISEPVELKEDFRLFKVGPVGPDDLFSCGLVLPRHWEVKPLDERDMVSLTPDAFTPLLFAQPALNEAGIPFIEVSVTKWPFDVELMDFFQLIAFQHGLEPQKIREIELKGVSVCDGIFEGVRQHSDTMARLMVFKNHSHLFKVWAVAGKQDFEEWFDSLAEIAIETFSLDTQSQSRFITERSSVSITTPFPMAFEFNSPWVHQKTDSPDTGTGIHDFKLLSVDQQTILSYSRLKVLASEHTYNQNFFSLKQSAIHEWEEQGFLEVEETKEQEVDYQGNPSIEGMWYEILGTLNGAPVSLWVTVIIQDEQMVSLATLVPEKDSQPMVWMAGKFFHTSLSSSLDIQR